MTARNQDNEKSGWRGRLGGMWTHKIITLGSRMLVEQCGGRQTRRRADLIEGSYMFQEVIEH